MRRWLLVVVVLLVVMGAGVAAIVLAADENEPVAPAATPTPTGAESPTASPTTAEKGPVPLELRGVYTAEIEEDIFDHPSTADLFAGEWTITIDEGSLRYELPVGSHATEKVRRRGEHFAVLSKPAPKGIWICFQDGNRTMTEGDATYDFIVVGEALGLAETVRFEAVEEPCPLRQGILERDWTATEAGATASPSPTY